MSRILAKRAETVNWMLPPLLVESSHQRWRSVKYISSRNIFHHHLLEMLPHFHKSL